MAFLLARHSLGDLDIWLHWRAGRDILAGTIPHANTYSFTAPDHPWIDHEWLFQVLIALAGKLAAALSALATPASIASGWNMLRVTLAVVLVLVLVRPRPGGTHTRAAWNGLGVLAALGVLWPRLTIRPELVSYILLAVTVPRVEACLRTEGDQRADLSAGLPAALDPRTPCGYLPWVTLLWAQFHGFSVLVPGLILLAGLLHPAQGLLSGRRKAMPLRRWALALGFSILALGLTPAGWRGWTYPLLVLGQFRGGGVDLQATISELAPLAQTINSLAWTLTAYRLLVAWGLLRIILSWRRISLLRVLLFAAAAAAAWQGERNIGLMAVAFALLHTDRAVPEIPGFPGLVGRRLRAIPGPAVPALAMLAVMGLWAPRILDNTFYLHEGVAWRSGGGLTPGLYPRDAAKVLAGAGMTRTFTNLDAAAYVLGNSPARLFIDGRTEAYPASLWGVYHRIKSGTRESLEELDRRQVEAVCLAFGGGAYAPLATALAGDSRWSTAAAGPGGILWRRAGSVAGPDPAPILTRAVDRTLDQAAAEPDPTRSADLYLAAARLARQAGADDRAHGALDRGLRRRPDHPGLLHNLGNLEMSAGKFTAAEGYFARAAAANPRQAGSLLNAGVCALRRGDPDAATRWFGRAVAVDPQDFQGWANLAVARQQSGDRPGAIAALDKALALRPGDQRLQAMRRQLRGS